MSARWQKFRVGQMVRVVEGSGLASGRLARVVSRDAVRVDGRGIPTNIEGAYSPVEWDKETAIRYVGESRHGEPSGKLDTMWNERLRPVFADCCECNRCGCERSHDAGELMCSICRSGACGD